MSQLRLSRRIFLLGIMGATAAGAGVWKYSRRNLYEGQALDPEMAYNLVQSGELVLIDIRRPDEWALTGSGVGAHRLDMRRDDFVTKLDKIIDGERSRPIALICARGIRSDHMSARLTAAGFTDIIDIPEGMLGSSAGPGWLNRGLPVEKIQ